LTINNSNDKMTLLEEKMLKKRVFEIIEKAEDGTLSVLSLM
jgi:hypothetical protein